jgi:hypothetical protein
MRTVARMVRAKLGIDKEDVPQVLDRAWAMYAGMDADPVTYGGASPPLPDFLVLIESLERAQQRLPTRTAGAGAGAERDLQRDLLVVGMQSELVFVQKLANADQARAELLIQNAGLLVAGDTAHAKALLTLKLGVQPGSVICDANVGLLVHAGGHKPRGHRFLIWEYTLDGGTTLLSAGSTPGCKTVLENLPRLTVVGVRVRLTSRSGSGAWTDVVTILVE